MILLQWALMVFGIPGAILADWFFRRKDSKMPRAEASMISFFNLAFWCGIAQTFLVLVGGAFLLGLWLAH